MKIAGAAMLLGACILFGFGWTGTMRKRITLLENLCGVIRRMETDLRQQNKPLAEIMEQEGFASLAKELRAGKLFSQAAEPLVKRLEHLFGTGETVTAVAELAWNLGRYDCTTQVEACKRACFRLEACKKQLEQELAEKQRLYRTVPVALGGMVLLIAI